MAHLSATRIMRSRFFPSSLGLMLLASGGKKIAQAALTFRTKSVMGPLAAAVEACDGSLPPLACHNSKTSGVKVRRTQ